MNSHYLAMIDAISWIVIYTVIVYFVLEYLPIPAWAKQVCQVLLVLIAITNAARVVMAADMPPMDRSLPSLGRTPSIIAPTPSR